MKEISVTVTAGEGSEQHNHDLEYRAGLKHVHQRDEPIIEFIPYKKSYTEQINDLMKPFIDEYNERVDKRYQEAWERYNSGQIKSKPRKRDYQKMSYDYCAQHSDDFIKNPETGKQEKIPLFRSLIIGIGDKEDRQSGKISEAEAKSIFPKIIEAFKEKFPDLKILGATLHLDEEGFYHCHLDYKPLMKLENENAVDKNGKTLAGLHVSVSQDRVLQGMGFKPEQSIINGRDKAPILFNTLRNKIYLMTEKALAEEGFRLQYGVSKKKEPDKDSSKNQRMEDWQAAQDAARELQHNKNVMLDIIAEDEVSPEGFEAFAKATAKIETTLSEIERQPRSRMNKDNLIVPFKLFDQMKTFVKSLSETVGHLFSYIEKLEEANEYFAPFKELWEKTQNGLEAFQRKYNNLRENYDEVIAENKKLRRAVQSRDEFLDSIHNSDNKSGKEMYQEYAEHQAQQRRQAQQNRDELDLY